MVDRPFSTLKHVKTWTRSTPGEYRLDGLCMLNDHREKDHHGTNFVEKVDEKVGFAKTKSIVFIFKNYCAHKNYNLLINYYVCFII